MKICSVCKIEQQDEEFAFVNRSAGKRHVQCHVCRKATAKASYQRNKQKVIADSRKRNRDTYVRFQEYKATLSCEVCPEDNACCLDFHHRNMDEKDFNVSEKVAQIGWTQLMQEIQKCAVLCANCHRKVHAGLISLASSFG